MIKGSQEKEKEVQVTAGWVLVEMHVTDWAATQKKDPKLEAVLQWLESKKKTNLRTLLREHALCEEGWIIWRNHQNFTASKAPFICDPCQKGRMRICYSLWCQRHTRLLPWMGAIEIQDIKAVTVHYLYCKNISGGPEWPNRWDKLLGPVNAASSMRVAPLRPIYAL